MGLNIKNPATEAAIRELAALRGVGLTEAIDDAVRHMLERERKRETADLCSIVAMIEAAHAPGDPPLEDPRAFLYDEDGLPA